MCWEGELKSGMEGEREKFVAQEKSCGPNKLCLQGVEGMWPLSPQFWLTKPQLCSARQDACLYSGV